jgi:hypothetical protein
LAEEFELRKNIGRDSCDALARPNKDIDKSDEE